MNLKNYFNSISYFRAVTRTLAKRQVDSELELLAEQYAILDDILGLRIVNNVNGSLNFHVDFFNLRKNHLPPRYAEKVLADYSAMHWEIPSPKFRLRIESYDSVVNQSIVHRYNQVYEMGLPTLN